MHQDSLPFLYEFFHLLANLKNVFVGGEGQILPVAIEVRHARIVDNLWIVGESNSITYETITAHWVFSWLFKVENCPNIQIL